MGEHVEPFLGRQPADDAEQGDVGARRQAGLLLQRRLAGRLAGEIADVEVGGQVLVGGGVPLVGVDAVQDADEVAVAPGEDAVQAVAVAARLDLARVGRADRR